MIKKTKLISRYRLEKNLHLASLRNVTPSTDEVINVDLGAAYPLSPLSILERYLWLRNIARKKRKKKSVDFLHI